MLMVGFWYDRESNGQKAEWWIYFLYVAGQLLNVKEKEYGGGRRQKDRSLLEVRLKSQMTVKKVLPVGKILRGVSRSSSKSPRVPGLQ